MFSVTSVRGIAGIAKVGFATCHLAKNIWLKFFWNKHVFFCGGWSSSNLDLFFFWRPPDHWMFPENDSLRKHEEKLTKHGCLSANVVLPQCHKHQPFPSSHIYHHFWWVVSSIQNWRFVALGFFTTFNKHTKERHHGEVSWRFPAAAVWVKKFYNVADLTCRSHGAWKISQRI
jgi:hypothetical protein